MEPDEVEELVDKLKVIIEKEMEQAISEKELDIPN